MNSASAMRAGTGAVLAVMFGLLFWRLFLFLQTSIYALHWPFELDYAEGIVLQQANLMFTPQAYGRIDGWPTIVFHYTPLYHVFTRVIAGLTGADMLYTGRAVSILATLSLAVLVGLIVARAQPADITRNERIFMATTGSLAVFCLFPVLLCGLLMRVDMLAVLLSMAGFWLGLKALERPALIYIAALCFVAALFTKQTAIASPAALFGLMLWLRPKLALRGIATCIVVGLLILAALTWMTDGGFLRHIFLYNINRISWSRLLNIFNIIAIQGPFFAIALVMALRRLADVRKRWAGQSRSAFAADSADVCWAAMICYFITSSLMLVTLAKSGAFLNYFIEWLLVMAMFVGSALCDAARIAIGRASRAPLTGDLLLTAVLVPCAVIAQALMIDIPSAAKAGRATRLQHLQSLSQRVRAADKPIISDEMVLLQRSSKRVMFEPMIFAELSSTGAWDERPFINLIRAHAFSMFITDQPHDIGRYTPAMWHAIDEAYPVMENQAGYTLHLPAVKVGIGATESAKQ